MKPFATNFTCILVFPSVFRHMVFQPGGALEQFTTVVARVTSTVVSSHVIFVVAFRNETSTTKVTQVWNTGPCDVGNGPSGPERK